MTKGIIFDLIQLDNGFLLTLFKTFKIGTITDDEGYGKYYTLLLGIKRLEFTLSLTWRTALNGSQKVKRKVSRSQKLLMHLLKGRTISGTQALNMFGIYRLSGVIKVFRDRGFEIDTKMITRSGRRYGVYRLTGTPK